MIITDSDRAFTETHLFMRPLSAVSRPLVWSHGSLDVSQLRPQRRCDTMLASKIICDDTYSNKCIVGQGMLALREIKQMEREMCSYLEWQLNVDPSTLRDFQNRVQRDFAGPGPYPPMVLPQPVPAPFAHQSNTSSTAPTPAFAPRAPLQGRLHHSQPFDPPFLAPRCPSGFTQLLFQHSYLRRRLYVTILILTNRGVSWVRECSHSGRSTGWNRRCAPTWSGSST
jgi:hypothetical protein